MVFDRGESGAGRRGVYLHSSNLNGPATIYPPTPQQYNALMDFLIGRLRRRSPVNDREGSEDQLPPCPLPIRATGENR